MQNPSLRHFSACCLFVFSSTSFYFFRRLKLRKKRTKKQTKLKLVSVTKRPAFGWSEFYCLISFFSIFCSVNFFAAFCGILLYLFFYLLSHIFHVRVFINLFSTKYKRNVNVHKTFSFTVTLTANQTTNEHKTNDRIILIK